MKYTPMIFLTLCLYSTIIYGQSCDCEQEFHWVLKTFEANDAGFQQITDAKGKQAFSTHQFLHPKNKSCKNNYRLCITPKRMDYIF